MTEEEKKAAEAQQATAQALPKPDAVKGLESWTPEQLAEAYDKSPELFAKAGILKQKVEEKKPDAASGAGAKAQEGAAQPDDLVITLPEGVPVDEVSLKKVKTIMGDKKLDNAQKLQQIVNLQAEEYRKAEAAAKQRDAKFEEALKGDPDFGKDFDANMEYAKMGLSKFDKSGEVAKRLVEIGANKDPVLTRYFRDIGKASGEAITKKPDTAPSKEAETVQQTYKGRYPNSPEMFEGESTQQ